MIRRKKKQFGVLSLVDEIAGMLGGEGRDGKSGILEHLYEGSTGAEDHDGAELGVGSATTEELIAEGHK